MAVAARNIRVLSVDDNQSMAQVIPSLLRGEPRIDYIMHLPNATAMCEFVAVHKIDVVLLDMLMPGPDPVVEMRRTLEAFPHTRFIVLTAAIDRAEAALAAGASAVVEKGAAASELVPTIFMAMGRRSEARAGKGVNNGKAGKDGKDGGSTISNGSGALASES